MDKIKSLIHKIANNAFYGFLLGWAVIFLITIPTSTFSVALWGSMFLGLLAIPLTALFIGFLDIFIFNN